MDSSGKYASSTTNPHKFFSLRTKDDGKYVLLVSFNDIEIGKDIYYSSEFLIDISNRIVRYDEFGVLGSKQNLVNFRFEEIDGNLNFVIEPKTTSKCLANYTLRSL